MLLTIIILAVSSFTAQFVQEQQMKMFAAPQRSNGIVKYEAPDYLRWEYLSPQPMVWELNGEKGNMDRRVKGLVALIRQCISGDFTETEKDFHITQDGNTVTLTPKKRETKRIFTEIVITLNPTTRIADRVEMSDANGDRTVITFSNVQMLHD